MDVFDLAAKITLDSSGYEQGLANASALTAKMGGKIGETIGKTVRGTVKVVGAALGAAATGISAITKQAISSYADYEQLVGGVETLFGSSAQRVLKDAQEAFKTAGMSTNEYMETSIQSAAALINSLGGDQAKAADLMNMSITDMADNVNKMGTTMEAVQNAYRGFSRGNFTMLDNLALGFAGTKEGMEQLLAKAKELSGVDYNIESYADIVQAIHVVQNEMGITGTTAKEASETIAGSIASMKSAWQNLVTGIADENADFGTLVGNFVDSVGTVADNLMPRIKTALSGIGQVIKELAPVISEALPDLLNEVLPSLLEAATSLVKTLAEQLPSLLQTLLDSLLAQAPLIVSAVKDIIFAVIDFVVSNLDKVVEVAIQIILELAHGLSQALPQLIPAVVDAILTIVDTLLDNLDLIIDAAIELIMALNEGIIAATPRLIEKIPELIVKLVGALIRNAPKVLKAGIDLTGQLAKGLLNGLGSIGKAVSGIFKAIWDGISQAIKKAFSWGKDLIQNFIKGIRNMFGGVKNVFSNLGNLIKGMIGFSEPEDPDSPLHNFHTYAPDMMALYAKGIRDNKHLLTDAVDDAFDIRPDITRNVTLNGAGTVGGEVIVPRVGGAVGTQTAILEIDRTAFAKIIFKLNNEESGRVGVKLAGVT